MKVIILRRIILFIGIIFIFFTWIFPGQIFYNKNGFLILTKTPYSHSKINAFEESNILYYYDCIINGYYVNLELPLGFFDGTPLVIKSDKLGKTEIDIIHYIKSENKKLYDIDINVDLTNTIYTKRQIKLIYDLFEYYMDENRILTIPNYDVNINKTIFISFVILVLSYLYTCKYNFLKHNKYKVNGIYLLTFLISMFIVGNKIISHF